MAARFWEYGQNRDVDHWHRRIAERASKVTDKYRWLLYPTAQILTVGSRLATADLDTMCLWVGHLFTELSREYHPVPTDFRHSDGMTI